MRRDFGRFVGGIDTSRIEQEGKLIITVSPPGGVLAQESHVTCLEGKSISPYDKGAPSVRFIERVKNLSLSDYTPPYAKQPLAIVSMVYNEPDFVPVWIKYYRKHVAENNLYLIDHGSNDGSTYGLGQVNVVRVPRTPFDERNRCIFISEFCNSLLRWYDCVIYTDIDEILVADPSRHADLVSYSRVTPFDVTTALGMHLAHHVPHEPELVLMAPILRQRGYALPVGSESKPLMTKRPLLWTDGFHYANVKTNLDDLFLFHIAYCDLETVRRRQIKRRTVDRAGEVGAHHAAEADAFVQHIASWATFSVIEADLSRDCPARVAFETKMFATRNAGNSRDQIDATVSGDGLWHLPGRLRDAF